MQPIEACAILFGRFDQNATVIEKIKIAKNRLHSTIRFEIDPEEVTAAINEAEKEGLEFIGLFHSHSSPATPSLLDQKFMRFWGDAFWLILSSTDGNLAAYQLVDGKIRKEILRVEKIPGDIGSPVTFEKVLIFSDGENVSIGNPVLESVAVCGHIVEQRKTKKIIVFKYKKRKRYRRKQGHRQQYTAVQIDSIKT